jgi:hypothetical protein
MAESCTKKDTKSLAIGPTVRILGQLNDRGRRQSWFLARTVPKGLNQSY